MAVVLVTVISRYMGTAAERAAMDTTGVRTGSEFFESDTGLTYIFNGATWTKKLYPATA